MGASGGSTAQTDDIEALILFTDVRGFTRWSEAIEVFAHLNDFVTDFLRLIREKFNGASLVKGLGDGAMIVFELGRSGVAVDTDRRLGEVLTWIEGTERGFGELCTTFAERAGHRAKLGLGWGVVHGTVKRMGEVGKPGHDYVGANVNKCARLCDVARPFGIVLDAEDFPRMPPEPRFTRQARRLGGVADDVFVWVTDEIASSFVPREKVRETPEVHIAGLCVDANARCGPRVLLARRVTSRSMFGGLYEGCGGQLAYSESFEAGVERHFRLEFGMHVRTLTQYHCFYEIKEPNHPLIPGIRFLCERVSEGEPSSPRHDDFRWVTPKELSNFDPRLLVPNLRDEAIELLRRYVAAGKSPTPAVPNVKKRPQPRR